MRHLTMINDTSHTQPIRRIAVIGSGIAGLSAAILLKNEGHQVSVFEKSRGPGGRLAAKRVADGSVDIGAQYFTIRNPRFLDLLNQYAGADTFARWEGRLGHQQVDGHWSAFHDEPRYVGVPRMTAITRALSRHVMIVTETRISGMRREDGQWWLEDSAGTRHGAFDRVLITAPPEQARALLAASSPTLPQKAVDRQLAGIVPCWALAVRFAEAPDWPFDGMRPNHPALFWIANNASKPGREGQGHWWVLHASADWSRAHIEADQDEVARELLAAFRDVTGQQLPVSEWLTHRWLYARSENTDSPGHLWYPEAGVGLAGDWLDGGRVEGAFNSACGLVDAMTKET